MKITHAINRIVKMALLETNQQSLAPKRLAFFSTKTISYCRSESSSLTSGTVNKHVPLFLEIKCPMTVPFFSTTTAYQYLLWGFHGSLEQTRHLPLLLPTILCPGKCGSHAHKSSFHTLRPCLRGKNFPCPNFCSVKFSWVAWITKI